MGEPLSRDTSPEIEARQIEAWRRMTPAEKGALVAGLTNATFELALAGIRQQYPDASPREHFLRLAIRRFGRELATRVYPDIASMNLDDA